MTRDHEQDTRSPSERMLNTDALYLYYRYRLSQANRKIPITEEMISWSILKKKPNKKQNKKTTTKKNPTNLDVERQTHR